MPRKERNGIAPRVTEERRYEKAVMRLMNGVYTDPLSFEARSQNYDPSNFLRSIQAIQQRVIEDPNFGEAEAEAAIREMNAYHRQKFQSIVRSVRIDLTLFGPAADNAVGPILEKALVDNVQLIRKLGVDYGNFAYERVEEIIRANTFDLQVQQQQIQELLSEDGTAGTKLRNRARLITRDQNNKILGDLTKARHQSVGGREYRWSTSADERVRSNHILLDRTLQSWDEPPYGGGTQPGERGHPGSGIQCRCVANLLFDDPKEKGA